MLKKINQTSKPEIAEIALPVPIRRLFDYQIPDVLENRLRPGMRSIVPFGRRRVTGIVVRIKTTTDVAADKIKPVLSVIDQESIVSDAMFKLCFWVSEYYQQPLGEVFRVALPASCLPNRSDLVKSYQLAESVEIEEVLSTLSRAPSQRKIIELLHQHAGPVDAAHLQQQLSGWRPALSALVKKRLIDVRVQPQDWPLQGRIKKSEPLRLSVEQQKVFSQISDHLDGFQVTLLKGVTGSGKTEVYLQLAQQILDLGKQILVLVPEIALTPQLVLRFEQRLGHRPAVLHSSLPEKFRRQSWQAAARSQAKVVLGTRSAVFAPIPDLGMIILDEEHDLSYKQTDGVRYHARDVAIMRAKQEDICIVMGSATPSLESLANVLRNRYRLCQLSERVADAVMPRISLLNLDQLMVKQGLSITLIKAIEDNLERKQQTLIFINRRGFAPVVICKQCGEMATCRQCHARLIFHTDGTLKCHHCGAVDAAGDLCRSCGSTALVKLGQGTQRIEQVLGQLFPQAKISRLDADTVRKKDNLAGVLERMARREIDILIGTQMLVKGHDFPMVTLVGVLNADQGLFGVDFHATETMVQQLIQVSGRAGRARNPGKVLIQTHFPGHPLYSYICKHDYSGFARQELTLRQQAGFPPYHYLALIRAWAPDEQNPMKYLAGIRRLGADLRHEFPMIKMMEPVYSPMAKLNNLYRAQLLLASPSRTARQLFLQKWIARIERYKFKKSVRWSIDVDPLDLY